MKCKGFLIILSLLTITAGSTMGLVACDDDGGDNNANNINNTNNANNTNNVNNINNVNNANNVNNTGYVPDPLGQPVVEVLDGSRDNCEITYIQLSTLLDPWIICITKGTFDNAELFIRTGTTWEEHDPPGNQIGAFILDENNTPHLAHSYMNMETYKYVFKYERRDDTEWGSVIIDTESETSSYNLDMAVDTAGKVHVVYEDMNENSVDDVVLKYASSDATSFLVETIDDSAEVNATHRMEPKIKISANGDVHVVYSIMVNEQKILRYAVRTGVAWTIEDIDVDTSLGYRLQFMLDSTGSPHIVVSQGHTGAYIYWLRRSGGEWSETVIRGFDYLLMAAELDSRDTPHILALSNYNLYYIRPSGNDYEEVLIIEQETVPSADLVLDSLDLPHISVGRMNSAAEYIHF
jgi:hypothetical protein